MIECRICPTCKNPFLKTDYIFRHPMGLSIKIASGSTCEDCSDRMRSAMLNGSQGFWCTWDEKKKDD